MVVTSLFQAWVQMYFNEMYCTCSVLPLQQIYNSCCCCSPKQNYFPVSNITITSTPPKLLIFHNKRAFFKILILFYLTYLRFTLLKHSQKNTVGFYFRVHTGRTLLCFTGIMNKTLVMRMCSTAQRQSTFSFCDHVQLGSFKISIHCMSPINPNMLLLYHSPRRVVHPKCCKNLQQVILVSRKT